MLLLLPAAHEMRSGCSPTDLVLEWVCSPGADHGEATLRGVITAPGLLLSCPQVGEELAAEVARRRRPGMA